MLRGFRESVKYGASFPCCCCQTLKWRKDVERVKDVEVLKSQEAKDNNLDTNLLNSCKSLFLMLDEIWICKECQKYIDVKKMPIFSTKNGLDATWRSIPSTLHDLSIKELDTIGLTQIFNVIEGLSTGSTGPDQMNKTLLLPLRRPVKVLFQND